MSPRSLLQSRDARFTFAREPAKRKSIYYGWIIVTVGFLAHIASAFSISSTLSVFLKPFSHDLGLSRGVFSLIRSGEILIGAAAAPVVGTLMDRYGGRWLMAAGGLVSGAGFICLGQARDFWQFLLVRWLLISPGDSLMGSMVVNVSISRWFVRMRGRALAIAGMGHGLAKVCMPVAAASLILYTGWRGAWVVFGLFTLAAGRWPGAAVHAPAPGRHGTATGWRPTIKRKNVTPRKAVTLNRSSGADEVDWTRREALRTPAFWLIVTTFGVAQLASPASIFTYFPMSAIRVIRRWWRHW